jgi:small subunit ribosomal protein S17
MNDEEKNDQTEEKKDEPQAEAEDAPKEEAPKEDAPEQQDAPKDDAEAPKDDGAPAGDAAEKDSDEEGSGAEDVPSDGEADAPAAEGDGAPSDDDEMDWKARRRLERSRLSGEAGPQRSPEDRAKERSERRGKASRGRSAYRKKQRTKRERGEGTSPAERDAISAKTRQGRVVSSKPDKTITVQIDMVRRHPSYEKIVRRSRTLHAHDAQNEANEGDLVRIVETRPLSRTKRWRLVEILEKAK